MKRTYNIGNECYALVTSPNDPEFLFPVKIVILEKCLMNTKILYKVKIREILENDVSFVKEHIGNIKVITSPKSDARISLINKSDAKSVNNIDEILQKISDKSFYLEDNYIMTDKDGLNDLYERFVKYIINYHFRKLYQVMNRRFLINKPVYIDQKDIFKKRVERLGFGDILQKYDMDLDI